MNVEMMGTSASGGGVADGKRLVYFREVDRGWRSYVCIQARAREGLGPTAVALHRERFLTIRALVESLVGTRGAAKSILCEMREITSALDVTGYSEAFARVNAFREQSGRPPLRYLQVGNLLLIPQPREGVMRAVSVAHCDRLVALSLLGVDRVCEDVPDQDEADLGWTPVEAVVHASLLCAVADRVAAGNLPAFAFRACSRLCVLEQRLQRARLATEALTEALYASDMVGRAICGERRGVAYMLAESRLEFADAEMLDAGDRLPDLTPPEELRWSRWRKQA